MRTRRREEKQSDWRFTMEHMGRELRKLYPPADTPPGWHDLFKEEHRRTAVMQQNHQEADESKDDPNSK